MIRFLPVKWQARIWWRIMQLRYGKTSHFKLEAIRALRGSAKISFKDAAELIKQVANEKLHHHPTAARSHPPHDPVHRPTMTDMMVDPDTLDAFMEANPLPPDPAAIREAAIREVAEAIRPEQDSESGSGVIKALHQIADYVLTLIPKGAAE